jgi:hypothetical protein
MTITALNAWLGERTTGIGALIRSRIVIVLCVRAAARLTPIILRAVLAQPSAGSATGGSS